MEKKIGYGCFKAEYGASKTPTNAKCPPHVISTGEGIAVYTESRKMPEVKYFITDRKIIIELGYELLGYTFGFIRAACNSAGERLADRG